MIKSVLILALVLSLGLPSAQSAYACAEEDILYWGTFSWEPSGTITHPTLPSLSGERLVLEIQVFTDVVYNKEVVVLTELIDLGYLDATSQPLELSDIQGVLQLGTSSTICGDLLSQIVGGLLLEPNVGTLALAYGIVNAVWIAPTLAGLGIGIYLIKKRT